MTKSQEIELLKTLIGQVPRDSYLASTLRHLAPQFEQDIRSDFLTLPDLREVTHEHWEAVKAKDAVLKELAAKREELSLAEARAKIAANQIAQAKHSLREIQYEIQNFCNRH